MHAEISNTVVKQQPPQRQHQQRQELQQRDSPTIRKTEEIYSLDTVNQILGNIESPNTHWAIEDILNNPSLPRYDL
jgi:transcription initiation factor TFIID subunit TAF12